MQYRTLCRTSLMLVVLWRIQNELRKRKNTSSELAVSVLIEVFLCSMYCLQCWCYILPVVWTRKCVPCLNCIVCNVNVDVVWRSLKGQFQALLFCWCVLYGWHAFCMVTGLCVMYDTLIAISCVLFLWKQMLCILSNSVWTLFNGC